MKAKLEFNLPEEKDEFTLAIKGINYFSILHDMHNYFRNKLKHGELSDKEYDAVEEAFDHFNSLMRDENVSFDEVE